MIHRLDFFIERKKKALLVDDYDPIQKMKNKIEGSYHL